MFMNKKLVVLSRAESVGKKILFVRFKDLETTHQSIINRHKSSRVIEFSTIIRRREDCHKLFVCKELIAFFDHLLSELKYT